MVKGGIYKCTDLFVDPPLTKAAMKKIITDYTDKRIAHDLGGTGQNQPYVKARKGLMIMIDSFADYVDIVADGNKAIIRAAGFEVSYDPSKLKGKKLPDDIERLTLKNHKKKSGVLISECEVFPPRTIFWAFLIEGSPIPEDIDFSKNGFIYFPKFLKVDIFFLLSTSRRKVLTDLKPGVIYYIYYLAVNNHGCSNLSKAASVMCL